MEAPYSPDRIKKRRARKTCTSCHSRKTRCDVQTRGIPCTSCVALGLESCQVRRRKNARAPTPQSNSPPDGPESAAAETTTPRQPQTRWNLDGQSSSYPTAGGPLEQRPDDSRFDYGNEDLPQTVDSAGAASMVSYDYATLADLEDIFNSTLAEPTPMYEPTSFANFGAYPANDQNDFSNIRVSGSIPFEFSHIEPARHNFLQSQGCLTLPPPFLLRSMLQLYFRFVHPHLPLLDEGAVWKLWNGDDFRLGNFSFLLMRCMLFTVVHFVETEQLPHLGFSNKREARLRTYQQAKLLYDFEVEKDPVANCQICLLLTYHSPNYNVNRINAGWLHSAARYARILDCENFHLIPEDPNRARVLKKLWWCLLFRDHSMGLGLRRRLVVAIQPSMLEEKYILLPEDFEPELGKSEVHDRETQLKLIEISRSFCRLIQVINPALQVIYRHERVDRRVAELSDRVEDVVEDVHAWLEQLRAWHRRTSSTFPSPISLDFTPDSVSVFANVVFCYHSSATLCLNVLLILLHETVDAARPLITLEEPATAIEASLDDTRARIQELLQVRLAKYLPISMSAYITPPLVMQALNVSFTRGLEMQESIESRKLEVFTRTLESQRQHFDGSDCIADLCTNIVSYVRDTRAFNGKDGNHTNPQRHKIMNYWLNRPRLLLRLLLRLDGALCTGGIDSEYGFPQELRREKP